MVGNYKLWCLTVELRRKAAVACAQSFCQLQPEVLPAQLGEGGLQRGGQRLEVGRGDTLHPDRVVVDVELVKYVLACNEINTVLRSYK